MTLLATILATVAMAPTEHRTESGTWRYAVASWYDEHGPGACNLGPDVQTGYRFASLILRCGTRVRFCRAGRCVVAVMADHGPYVAGRTFDLNYALHNALGGGGVCQVRWQIV